MTEKFRRLGCYWRQHFNVAYRMIYGGIKLVKGKEIIELPDGTREGIDYGYLFYPKAENMYYGITAKRGWEWFNSVALSAWFSLALCSSCRY